MKIAIGCDHGGYLLKQDILIWLEEHDIDFEDVGCFIRQRQELLRECGFRYFTTFEQGKPRFQAL